MSGYQRKPSAPLWHLCPTDQLSNGTPRHGAAAPDAEPGALRSGYGPSCRRVEGELGSVRRCKGAEWRHWFSAAEIGREEWRASGSQAVSIRGGVVTLRTKKR